MPINGALRVAQTTHEFPDLAILEGLVRSDFALAAAIDPAGRIVTGGDTVVLDCTAGKVAGVRYRLTGHFGIGSTGPLEVSHDKKKVHRRVQARGGGL